MPYDRLRVAKTTPLTERGACSRDDQLFYYSCVLEWALSTKAEMGDSELYVDNHAISARLRRLGAVLVHNADVLANAIPQWMRAEERLPTSFAANTRWLMQHAPALPAMQAKLIRGALRQHIRVELLMFDASRVRRNLTLDHNRALHRLEEHD